MPTSASQRRATKPQPPAPSPKRSLWLPLTLMTGLAALAVAAAALPASLIGRFLPPSVHAEDFSGTLWHGSAGHLTAVGREAGAVEWHLHPLALLGLRVSADLHWVKGGVVLDGTLQAKHGALAVSNITGGGPIADLASLGLAAGWQGTAQVRIQELDADLSAGGASLKSATGELSVADVSSRQVANGAELGGYLLKFANPSLGPDAEATATLADTGGPLSLDATIRLTPKTRTGLFSGAIAARPDASPALRDQLQNLAQLHARDAQGRIPIDLEFTF